MNRIVVFGSLNMDLVVRAPRLPVPGETVRGHTFFTAPGGKGANQAVAAARLGAPTVMVGRVGGDPFGTDLLENLQAAGVDVAGVLVDRRTHSGVAVIVVDDRGQNQIVIAAGANGRVESADVERLRPFLDGAALLLLQLEVPLPAVVEAARAAQHVDVPVMLDPAPASADLPDELYRLTDYLTPNEVEAAHLVGFPLDSEEAIAEAARRLRQRGASTVIIKLGARGAYCASDSETFFVPAFPVKAVDTVAAGDAFNGGLAVALAEGRPLHEAIRWAAAVGALSVTREGAQPSMPTRAEVEAFWQAAT